MQCTYTASTPLYTSDRSALDPCLVRDVGLALIATFGVLAACTVVRLSSTRGKGHQVRYFFGSFVESVGQKLRLFVVLLYATLFNMLIWDSDALATGYLLAAPSVAAIGALHLIEPTKRVTQSATLLWFWTAAVVYHTTCLAQDLWSPVKIWAVNGCVTEVSIWLCCVANLALEVFAWRPTPQLVEYYHLNGWNAVRYNTFANLSFAWLHPLLSMVYRTDKVDLALVPEVPPQLDVAANYAKLSREWHCEVARHTRSSLVDKVSLLWCILRAYWPLIAASFVLETISTVLIFVEPFLQQHFILLFDASQPRPIIVGYTIAGLFFVVSMAKTILSTQSSQLKSKMVHSANSIQSMIYRKALNLSSELRQNMTVGQVLNHISLDVPTITSFPTGPAVRIVIAPFKVVLCIVSLYKIIGHAVWGGVVAAFVVLPLVSKIKAITTPLTKKIMRDKDSRLQLMNEVLSSILSVKLYTWEALVELRLHSIRNDNELRHIRQQSVWSAFSNFVFSTVPFVICCSSFCMFVVVYKEVPLSPDIVFPALSLFAVLGNFISSTSGLLQRFIKAKVAYKRVEDFLLLDEKRPNQITRTYGFLGKDSDAISMHNASFCWHENDATVALTDINLDCKMGSLVCIVGKVGSGKTTLLRAMLGDLPLIQGTNHVHGSVAYCSQQGWIINATVRDNILFGHDYDHAMYERAIDVCELHMDIQTFPEGDSTLVGEKGISLSGGQRARISLARAIYSRADVYVLDDILSAVDRYVGRRIIQNVLGKHGVLALKTRILVTNYIPIIHIADEVLLVANGCIMEKRVTNALAWGHDSELERLLKEYGGDAKEVSQKPELVETKGVDSRIDIAITGMTSANEQSSTGKVKASVFFEYFKACNFHTIFIYAALIAMGIGLSVYQTALFSDWSSRNSSAGHTIEPVYYLSLYAVVVVLKGASYMLGLIIVWVFSFIKGSQYFHDKMIHNVLRSPMAFFETTPVGTILNRFSNDVSAMDLNIPWVFVAAVNLIISSFASFAIIIWRLPLISVVIVALAVVYNSIRSYYIPASREFKRLSRGANSPILAHLLESLNGVDTLAAYGQTDRYVEINEAKVAAYIRINYTNTLLSRWLAVRLQTISSTILFSTCVFCLLTTKGPRAFDAAMVGFILNYALTIPSQLRSIITMWTQVETQTVAIERIIDYCNLPSEADTHTEDVALLREWPLQGAVDFVNYATKYRDDLPLVLKEFNLKISPREKVGIVGRTGSGKSTITRALFRLLEGVDGHIAVDGVSIDRLGLFDLRHNLSIIPQNCQTIEGTIRQNLDPANEHTDEEIWQALDMSDLKKHVEQMRKSKADPPGGLEAYVSEGGSNLSGGQKQLLCLARALLSPAKILILDEATAAVDMETDAKVQRTIRQHFSHKTIITIAHRLETIMDGDRVVEIEDGRVKRDGLPEAMARE